MKENGKVSVIYSWPVIILALCLFWPVGIFLTIKRVGMDKKAALSVGKMIGIAGGFSYAIAIVGFIGYFPDEFTSEDISLIIFFCLAGFVLRKVAKKIKNDAESVKQYLAIIVNGNVRQLDNIAATTGKSYEVVRTEVQKMIQKGYLKNAYIDESTREVVLPNNRPVETTATYNNVSSDEKHVTKIVVCPCCGANNTIVGESGECEYCGSPIK